MGCLGSWTWGRGGKGVGGGKGRRSGRIRAHRGVDGQGFFPVRRGRVGTGGRVEARPGRPCYGGRRGRVGTGGRVEARPGRPCYGGRRGRMGTGGRVEARPGRPCYGGRRGRVGTGGGLRQGRDGLVTVGDAEGWGGLDAETLALRSQGGCLCHFACYWAGGD
jgi:hypothetical protein